MGSSSRRFVERRNRELERPFLRRVRVGQAAFGLAALACLWVIPDDFARGFIGALTLSAIPILQAHLRGMTGSEFRLMGPEAEGWTAKELRGLGREWSVVHNVQFDGLDVDHVAVGPSTLVVLETKWSSDPDRWRSRRERDQLLAQATRNADKIRMLMGLKHAVALVVCWAPGWSNEDVRALGESAYLVGGRQVASAIEQLAQDEPATVIPPEAVTKLTRYHERFRARAEEVGRIAATGRRVGRLARTGRGVGDAS